MEEIATQSQRAALIIWFRKRHKNKKNIIKCKNRCKDEKKERDRKTDIIRRVREGEIEIERKKNKSIERENDLDSVYGN